MQRECFRCTVPLFLLLTKMAFISPHRYSHIFNQKSDRRIEKYRGILFDLTPNSQSYHYTKYMKDSAENWKFDLGSESVKLQWHSSVVHSSVAHWTLSDFQMMSSLWWVESQTKSLPRQTSRSFSSLRKSRKNHHLRSEAFLRSKVSRFWLFLGHCWTWSQWLATEG